MELCKPGPVPRLPQVVPHLTRLAHHPHSIQTWRLNYYHSVSTNGPVPSALKICTYPFCRTDRQMRRLADMDRHERRQRFVPRAVRQHSLSSLNFVAADTTSHLLEFAGTLLGFDDYVSECFQLLSMSFPAGWNIFSRFCQLPCER